MKKLTALLLALLMILPAAAPAEESPAAKAFDAVYGLFFGTDNVTIHAEAVFSMDGERFKTARTDYIQDGDRSLWQLQYLTPRADGTEKESGWTIIANAESVFVMEVLHPGTYRAGTGPAQKSILRESVQTALLAQMLRALAARADSLLGADAVTAGSGEFRLRLDGNVPEELRRMLDLAVQTAARRYFSVDYDRISAPMMTFISSYPTVTEGILHSTKAYLLRGADVSVRTDDEGRVLEISGSASLDLETGREGTHLLEVSFRLEASDYGSSMVRTFDPEDYGVRLQDSASGAEYSGPSPIPPHDDRSFPEDVEDWQRQLWAKAGYDPDRIMASGNASCEFAEDGTLTMLQDSGVPWLTRYTDGTEIEWFDEITPPPEELKEKVVSFLAFANPGMERYFDYRQVWQCRYGEETFMEIEGYPKDGGEDTITFVVRVSPDPCIQFFACISFG